ncbi:MULTISPECIES: hypothetical protein [unclassified Streptomyces]|uniref:hypothetical protein n=1 Tax=unclassified Streptomyces TaxID=2593676 RepID=UPI00278BF996|nr:MULTISPECIES: hypothetical protein [unclassified Streptomyces]
MSKHTTDDVYDKVVDLKKAIAKGPDDKKTDLKGALAELPVLKEILAVAKAGGGPAYIVLGIVALKAGLSSIGIKIFDIQKGIQALTRKLTGGKELTTTDSGRFAVATPEEPRNMRLPTAGRITALKEAVRKLNGEIHIYSTKSRALPSPRNMKQLADSAGRLSSAASKHGDVARLAANTHTLTQRFQELSRAVGSA